MANTPSYAQWRYESSPIVNSSGATILGSQQLLDRIASAFASVASGQNPDGTVRGT